MPEQQPLIEYAWENHERKWIEPGPDNRSQSPRFAPVAVTRSGENAVSMPRVSSEFFSGKAACFSRKSRHATLMRAQFIQHSDSSVQSRHAEDLRIPLLLLGSRFYTEFVTIVCLRWILIRRGNSRQEYLKARLYGTTFGSGRW